MTKSSSPATTEPRRNEETRQAILTAALDLVQEHGYGGTSIEGIAARAGAGKQTIYRWWRSKAEVVLEALRLAAAQEITVPETGVLRTELELFLRRTFAAARREPYRSALPALMAAAQLDPEFAESVWRDFLQERRRVLRALLARAAARDGWQPRVETETAIDLIFGPLWYGLLTRDRPLGMRLAAELADVITGLGGGPGSGR